MSHGGVQPAAAWKLQTETGLGLANEATALLSDERSDHAQRLSQRLTGEASERKGPVLSQSDSIRRTGTSATPPGRTWNSFRQNQAQEHLPLQT